MAWGVYMYTVGAEIITNTSVVFLIINIEYGPKPYSNCKDPVLILSPREQWGAVRECYFSCPTPKAQTLNLQDTKTKTSANPNTETPQATQHLSLFWAFRIT